MKFVATRPCEFYVDQLFNLHGNDEGVTFQRECVIPDGNDVASVER
jgi:hypothetical protein